MHYCNTVSSRSLGWFFMVGCYWDPLAEECQTFFCTNTDFMSQRFMSSFCRCAWTMAVSYIRSVMRRFTDQLWLPVPSLVCPGEAETSPVSVVVITCLSVLFLASNVGLPILCWLVDTMCHSLLGSWYNYAGNLTVYSCKERGYFAYAKFSFKIGTQ